MRELHLIKERDISMETTVRNVPYHSDAKDNWMVAVVRNDEVKFWGGYTYQKDACAIARKVKGIVLPID